MRDKRTDLTGREKTSLKHKHITCRSNHCTGNPETTNAIQGHAKGREPISAAALALQPAAGHN